MLIPFQATSDELLVEDTALYTHYTIEFSSFLLSIAPLFCLYLFVPGRTDLTLTSIRLKCIQPSCVIASIHSSTATGYRPIASGLTLSFQNFTQASYPPGHLYVPIFSLIGSLVAEL